MKDREALLKKAYDLGFEYEKTYRGCAQCVVAALQDTFDIRDDAIFKAASGFAGGCGLTGIGVCGGFAGAVMVLSQLLGRERTDFSDPKGVRFKSFDIASLLADRFLEEFGTVICHGVQEQKFGRSYNLRDPDEFKKFHDAGAHDVKCPEVVGKAAQMAVEIALAEGLVA
jgi:C_GCAxxG_C_C family probable redox protein